MGKAAAWILAVAVGLGMLSVTLPDDIREEARERFRAAVGLEKPKIPLPAMGAGDSPQRRKITLDARGKRRARFSREYFRVLRTLNDSKRAGYKVPHLEAALDRAVDLAVRGDYDIAERQLSTVYFKIRTLRLRKRKKEIAPVLFR